MNQAKYFTLGEMTRTNTGLPNVPTGIALGNVQEAMLAMDAIRVLLGKPIAVSSCYRSPAVNAKVGGSSTSAHSIGAAVDFTCPQFGSPRDVCKALLAAGVVFDQLILEGVSASILDGQWVHIGFKRPAGGKPRMQVLTMSKGKYTQGLN